MQIIPVIDLKDGFVVHAVRGERGQYQRIHQCSRLTDSSEMHAVVAGLLHLYPFRQFYIADLNAIGGLGDHQVLIDELLNKHPDIDFWIDNGCQLSEIKACQPNRKWVIGTESQSLPPQTGKQNYILSLDYKNRQALGHPAWFEQIADWPDTLIVMNLNKVGSNTGPDLEKLVTMQQSHPDKQWVAAGGIRHVDDLLLLKQTGIHAVLLATALHNGNLTQQALQNLLMP